MTKIENTLRERWYIVVDQKRELHLEYSKLWVVNFVPFFVYYVGPDFYDPNLGP